MAVSISTLSSCLSVLMRRLAAFMLAARSLMLRESWPAAIGPTVVA
jgi:hypothetical protein